MSAEGENSDSSCSGSDILRRKKSHGGVRKRKLRTRKCLTKCAAVLESSNSGCDLPDEGSRSEVNDSSFSKHQFVSLDCEMVEVVGNKSVLAKCSIIDYDGHVLFNEYVRPERPITDYRTRWSGVESHHMKQAVSYTEAAKRIKDILEGRIVIGHDLINDFCVIGIQHPFHRTRDTAKFIPLREIAGLLRKQRPSLRNLAAGLLNRRIQNGSHCSREDAQAALDIYRKYEEVWEGHLLDSKSWLEDRFWPKEICVSN